MMATGPKMAHVPLRGSSEIMTNLMGGHIDLAFDNMPVAWPQAQEGKVRAIPVTSLQRSSAAPDLPAVAETVPNFDVTGWMGIYLVRRYLTPMGREMYSLGAGRVRAGD